MNSDTTATNSDTTTTTTAAAAAPSPSPTDSMSSGEDLGQFDFEDKTEESSTPVTPATKSTPTTGGESSEETKTATPAKKSTSPKKSSGAVFVTEDKEAVPASASFELLYWKDVKTSSLAFGSGSLTFYMFMQRGHTMLSLAATAIALNLLVNGVHTLVKKSPLFPYVSKYLPATLPTALDALDSVTTSALALAVRSTVSDVIKSVRARLTKSLNECSSIVEFAHMFGVTYMVYLVGEYFCQTVWFFLKSNLTGLRSFSFFFFFFFLVCVSFFFVLLFGLRVVFSGTWFSPLSLCLAAFVLAFSIPKTYQTFQKPIDEKISKMQALVGEKYTQLVKSQPQLEKVIDFVTNASAPVQTKKDL